MRMQQNQPVSVFQFFDAREFLLQAFNREKRLNPVFSHRYIAKTMGARSSSFFKDVLNGRIRLSPTRIRGFIRLFKLNKLEAEYFENLILYTQTEKEEDKGHYLEKLMLLSNSSPFKILEAFQMEYFKKCFYAVVREALAIHDFQGDYQKLAEMLEPPITAGEAMNAVNLLLKLKLIRKNARGGFEKIDKVVSSGTTGNPDSIKPAIRENLDLAHRALNEYPPEIRPFSYLTLSISGESFLQIRETIRRFRKEILNIAARDEAADRLYQLNFQLFPLSKIVKRGK
jgi:uncharacterized protein (TIGR02147 family)